MKSKELNFVKKGKRSSTPQQKTIPTTTYTTKNLNLSDQAKVRKSLNNPRHKRRTLILFFAFAATFGVLLSAFVYFFYIPAKRVYDSSENIKSNLYEIVSDLKNKDISRLETNLNEVKSEIKNINGEIDKFDFLATWDKTKGYYDNFQQAQVILKKTDDLITQTLPELESILKLSGFKVTETEVSTEENSDGAILSILKQLPQYLNLYEDIEPKIEDILAEVKKIDPEYVPEGLGFDVKDNLEQINSFADQFGELSEKTVNFVRQVPKLLGSNGETTYLVILQNETEMRSSGGLLTAFGTMKVSNGEIADDISLTDTWQLQYDMWRIGLPMPKSNIYGQAALMNAGCGANEARVQDVGLYPDLNISMGYVQQYYDRARKYFPAKYPAYDQVVIINYAFSENLLELVQPLNIEGFGEVTAENLYNFIKDETDNPEVFYDEGRKDIIKTIATQAKEKLLGLDLKEIPNVLNLIVSSFKAKDIALKSNDLAMQSYFDEYGMSGRSAQEYEGDYFQFNEAQNCSLKLNKFIRDTVDLNINIADDGSISNNVQVKWQNPQIYNDSLANQYSKTLQFSYRAWVRFFAPKGSTNFISDGFSRSGYLYYTPKQYNDSEMNKAVSDNIVQFDHRRFKESDPIERDEMNVSWKLPNSLNYNDNRGYSLLIQKHPGKSWGESYNIDIDYKGSTYNVAFTLDQDKVIKFNDGVISVENYNTSLDWILDLSNKIPWGEIGSEEQQQ